MAIAEQDRDQQADANRERQQQIFFDKHVPKSTHCWVPWQTMGINANGNIFICESPSWVPKFVGNILEVTDVYDALNSQMAQAIRREILENRYYYCNHKISRVLAPKNKLINVTPSKDDLAPLPFEDSESTRVTSIPKNLIFDFDYTCNFRCPSCRTELINNNKHHVIRPINDNISSKIKELVIDKIGTQAVEIRWAGGEPFISEVYVDLMRYCVNSKKNIKHVIQTNGSYLISKADLLEELLPHVKELRISFDAATADTYSKIRVGGVWENLINNVKHVKEQIARLNAKTVVAVELGDGQNVYARYNTNLSRVEYKGINLFRDILNRIRDWQVCASLDGTGPIGEYIRTGLDYDQWLRNFSEGVKIANNRRQMRIDFTLTLPGMFEVGSIQKLANEFGVDVLAKVIFSFSPDIVMSPLALPREVLHPWVDEQIQVIGGGPLKDVLVQLKTRPTFEEQWPDEYKDAIVRGKERVLKLEKIRGDTFTMRDILSNRADVLAWWDSI